jgi:branched-chain amino acid transport system substrate-binding protein
VTKNDPAHPFPVVGQLMFYPAEIVAAPVGQKSAEWVKTLKPSLVDNPQIQRVGH